MQGVAEFMEHGLHLVDVHVLGEVAHVHDDGAHVIAFGVNVLLAHIVHPRPSPLACTGEIVGREYAHEGAVGVGNLIGVDPGVVDGHAVYLLGVDAVTLK